jgi:hypothetical protein
MAPHEESYCCHGDQQERDPSLLFTGVLPAAATFSKNTFNKSDQLDKTEHDYNYTS